MRFKSPAGQGCPQRERHVGNGNPTYRLSDHDRWALRVLARLGLWTDQALADEFGVSRRRVYAARQEAL